MQCFFSFPVVTEDARLAAEGAELVGALPNGSCQNGRIGFWIENMVFDGDTRTEGIVIDTCSDPVHLFHAARPGVPVAAFSRADLVDGPCHSGSWRA